MGNLYELWPPVSMLARGGAAHSVAEGLDHGAIFVLIAGTFTPVHGLLFAGRLRWVPLLFIWTATAVGITLENVYFSLLAAWVGLGCYLMLDWCGAVTVGLPWRRHGFRFVRPLVWGGLAYAIGAVTEYLGMPVLVPGVVQAHEVFHLAVVAGALWHWSFI